MKTPTKSDLSPLAFLKKDLRDEIEKTALVKVFPKNTEILKESQSITLLPIVLSGVVKVYSRFEEKELLLYYIEPAQSCVMTFFASLKNLPSKIFAITEEDSKLLLLPVQYLPRWLREYPDFNELFYTQYNHRYIELLDTIGHLLLDKMDKRIYDHLHKKTEMAKNRPIKMSHSQLASELGTVREVITRVLKKLEIEGKIQQTALGLKIIGNW